MLNNGPNTKLVLTHLIFVLGRCWYGLKSNTFGRRKIICLGLVKKTKFLHYKQKMYFILLVHTTKPASGTVTESLLNHMQNCYMTCFFLHDEQSIIFWLVLTQFSQTVRQEENTCHLPLQYLILQNQWGCLIVVCYVTK